MVRCLLAISILFPWMGYANDSTVEEQKKAVGRHFSQMEVASEVQRWGAIYIQLIQNNLPDQLSYVGEVCRVNIRLHPSGIIRRVTILPSPTNSKTTMNDLLCNEAFLSIYKVKQFPMPEQDNVKKRLQNINLTVEP